MDEKRMDEKRGSDVKRGGMDEKRSSDVKRSDVKRSDADDPRGGIDDPRGADETRSGSLGREAGELAARAARLLGRELDGGDVKRARDLSAIFKEMAQLARDLGGAETSLTVRFEGGTRQAAE